MQTIGIILFIIAIIVGIKEFYRSKNQYLFRTGCESYDELDDGKYGEALIYDELKEIENDGGVFLFNVYLPAKNGKTSECDVILLHYSGIYIFESKNLSGTIYGDEKYSEWNAYIKGKSYKFTNPIIQNKTHIYRARKLLPGGKDLPIFSIIAFSDRCNLKKLKFNQDEILFLGHRNLLKSALSPTFQEDRLSYEEIKKVYSLLLPFSKVDEDTKLNHIENIKSKKNRSKHFYLKKQPQSL